MHENEQRDIEEFGTNNSGNTDFATVLQGYMSRRNLLRGSLGTATTLVAGRDIGRLQWLRAVFGYHHAAAPGADAGAVTELQHGGSPRWPMRWWCPAGYTAKAIYALGDPITTSLAAYKNDGTEAGASFAFRAGDHHDGMAWFGLSASGTPDATSNTRGLIAINHEKHHAGVPACEWPDRGAAPGR